MARGSRHWPAFDERKGERPLVLGDKIELAPRAQSVATGLLSSRLRQPESVIRPGAKTQSAPESAARLKPCPDTEPIPLSVLRHVRIDLVAPGQNAALHIANVLEAGLAEDAAGLCAAHAALAMNH